jgi:hypothetical protein
MAEVASWALQRSVYQALAGSSALTTLLGGARIYDDAPQGASFPFITLGQSVFAIGAPAPRTARSTASRCMSGLAAAARSRCMR